jgi:hypothetical protein
MMINYEKKILNHEEEERQKIRLKISRMYLPNLNGESLIECQGLFVPYLF